jgi:type II secretory pathway component PulC
MIRSLAVGVVLLGAFAAFAHAEDQKISATKESAQNHTAGYRLSDIKPGSVYEKMGLKNGDMIIEVNGKPATQKNVLNVLNLSQEAGKTLVLKIKRDGKIQNLQYDIK